MSGVVVSISRLYSKMKNTEIYLKKGVVLETEQTIYYLGSVVAIYPNPFPAKETEVHENHL